MGRYCCVKLNEKWIFTIFGGKDKDEKFKWQFFSTPDGLDFGQIQEWQPVHLNVSFETISIDPIQKRLTININDLLNEEDESMWYVFQKDSEVVDGNSNGDYSNLEVGGDDLQTEIFDL